MAKAVYMRQAGVYPWGGHKLWSNVDMDWTPMRSQMAVVMLALVGSDVSADEVADCRQVEDLDLRIAGCTAFIEKYDGQDGEVSKAFVNRGVAHAKLGQYQRALDDYDHALELMPGSYNAYVFRAEALMKTDAYEKALIDLHAAKLLRPEYEGGDQRGQGSSWFAQCRRTGGGQQPCNAPHG